MGLKTRVASYRRHATQHGIKITTTTNENCKHTPMYITNEYNKLFCNSLILTLTNSSPFVICTHKRKNIKQKKFCTQKLKATQ